MSYINSIKKRLNETVLHNKEEVEEVSDSGAVAAIATPYAFGDVDDDTIEIDGFKKVAKKKIHTQEESVFAKISKDKINN